MLKESGVEQRLIGEISQTGLSTCKINYSREARMKSTFIYNPRYIVDSIVKLNQKDQFEHNHIDSQGLSSVFFG